MTCIQCRKGVASWQVLHAAANCRDVVPYDDRPSVVGCESDVGSVEDVDASAHDGAVVFDQHVAERNRHRLARYRQSSTDAVSCVVSYDQRREIEQPCYTNDGLLREKQQ